MVAAHSQVVHLTWSQPIYQEQVSRSLFQGPGSCAFAIECMLVSIAADTRSAGVKAQKVREILAITMWLLPKRSGFTRRESYLTGTLDPVTTAE